MKQGTLAFLVVLQLRASAQLLADDERVTGAVMKIEMVGYSNGICRDGWKSYYYYDNDGRLAREVGFYKTRLMSEVNHQYFVSDGQLITKELRGEGEEFVKRIRYQDQTGKINKDELYFERDTLKPAIVDHHFLYDLDSNIVSFKRSRDFSVFNPKAATDTTCFELSYSEGKLIELTMLDSCSSPSEKRKYRYDKLGNRAYETIDCLDPNEHVLGGRSEHGVQRFYYKFDRHGNWTKRYYVMESGRKVLELKRRITYRKRSP